jgi:trehalose 6-phosphate synthase
MSRLVVISNRVALPRETRAGGLAPAVLSALADHGGVWVGWSGRTADPPGPPTVQNEGPITYVTFDLTKDDYDEYYNGFANRTLWPLLHFRLDLVDYRRDTYRAYQRVNRIFARTIAPLLKPDDLIWVHDYHLIPLAALLREEGVSARIGFFLHTPLPPPDLLSALPGSRALMDSMTDYDLVGFQTPSDSQAFIDYLRDVAGAKVTGGDVIHVGSHPTRVLCLPISIDADLVAGQASRAITQPTVRRLRESLLGRWMMIGVDRLDYSKGLNDRFLAFSRFIERYPEHRRQVAYLQIAPTSRGEVPEYRMIRSELERQAGAVNGRFAEADWVPLRYVNRTYPQSTLAGFYRVARVGLVTPLRDGMNLVAKEYVAAQDPEDPGVLVLSQFAGASRELTSALVVNPHDVESVSDAMHRAVSMTLRERRRRWGEAMDRLHEWSITDWREAFVAALAATPTLDRKRRSR